MCARVHAGTGENIGIRELATLLAEVVGYQGENRSDPEKTDGALRKRLDVSRLRALGRGARMALREELEETPRW